VWIGLVGMASSIFNQLLERDTDARMLRTARRPLVTGRVRARDAIWGGTLLTVAGVLGLALRFNTLVALLTLATMVAYVLV
jgi:protoheme IX farnesyltransferase